MVSFWISKKRRIRTVALDRLVDFFGLNRDDRGGHPPKAWRGAASQRGSSTEWQQAAPGHGLSARQSESALCKSVPIPSASSCMANAGSVPGSRLLPSDRATTLQSGSPPDAGRATPQCYQEDENDSPGALFCSFRRCVGVPGAVGVVQPA